MQTKRVTNPIIRLEIDGEERSYSSSEFFKRIGVISAIRIPEVEFDSIDQASDLIAHFNLEETTHRMGEKYLCLKILEHGIYNETTGEDQTPLLSLDDAFVAECIAVENHIPYDNLTAKYFEHSFAGISDVISLQDAILRRYEPSRIHVSREEILAKGVGYTLLKRVPSAGIEPALTP